MSKFSLTNNYVIANELNSNCITVSPDLDLVKINYVDEYNVKTNKFITVEQAELLAKALLNAARDIRKNDPLDGPTIIKNNS